MINIFYQNTEKNKFIIGVLCSSNIKLFITIQKNLNVEITLNIQYFPPAVTKWLKRFRTADSFHGCVFSIIFNEPFLAVGNKHRGGGARSTSLLKTFNVESRLISENFSFNEKMIDVNINWEDVNQILKKERRKSFSFLENSLN